jgi:hypothetical protein
MRKMTAETVYMSADSTIISIAVREIEREELGRDRTLSEGEPEGIDLGLA